MKKQVTVDTPQYRETTICDNCGGESLQDDVVQQSGILGIVLDLHRDCISKVEKKIRRSMGLYERSEIIVEWGDYDEDEY